MASVLALSYLLCADINQCRTGFIWGSFSENIIAFLDAEIVAHWLESFFAEDSNLFVSAKSVPYLLMSWRGKTLWLLVFFSRNIPVLVPDVLIYWGPKKMFDIWLKFFLLNVLDLLKHNMDEQIPFLANAVILKIFLLLLGIFLRFLCQIWQWLS